MGLAQYFDITMQVLVVLLLGSTLLVNQRVQGVRMCGRRLADLLNFICERHGGFHGAKRDTGSESSKRGVLELVRPRRTEPSEVLSPFRSGVVDECCRKQCTLATLASYCARHVGSIDLDEMLPPGSVPTLSAEDLAELQLPQQDSSKVSEEPAARLHASRPNLGQFMRNRPVFIVMSQLQADEDRALGDYRF